jgi:hypothetical protein
MSNTLRNGLIRLSLIAMLACYYVGGLVADNAKHKSPSQFAPLSDLTADLQRRIFQLERATRQADTTADLPLAVYDEAQVISIVASQMAIHDQSLAGNSPSRELPPAVEKSAATPSPELAVLMRQFPLCYQQIHQGIYSTRFSAEHAGLAARCSTVALLADYCGHQQACCPADSQRRDWQRICFELRDSAADVNLACHQQSQTAAVAALSRMGQSVEAWLAAADAPPH